MKQRWPGWITTKESLELPGHDVLLLQPHHRTRQDLIGTTKKGCD
ncbi:hypothetical protein ACFLUM_01215 [Chloroflexota bacterium]